MLSITGVQNEEKTVYTVPTGKNAFIYLDIIALSPPATVTVKVNDYTYATETISKYFSAKLVLNSSDVIKVQSDSEVNVFVHGNEV